MKANATIESKLNKMTRDELIEQLYSIGSTIEYGSNSVDIPWFYNDRQVRLESGKELYEALDTCYEAKSRLCEKITGELYDILMGSRQLFSRELKESVDHILEIIMVLEEMPIHTEEESK